jgi:eukaryotic-like serine/threonine-protein kinase
MAQPEIESRQHPTELATALAAHPDAEQKAGRPAPLRDTPPTRVGRYRLLERLGDGGTATVHAAVDTHTGQRVAVKVMRTDRVDHPGVGRAFQREAAVLGALDDPGVPTLIDRGITDDGRLWLAMEEVPGRTLTAVLATAQSFSASERRGFVDDVLLPAFREVCEVVASAHQRGHVHRDLKPSNLILGADGHVRVLDWGLSRPVGFELPTWRRGVTGTPGYISPDQLDPDSRLVDRRGDVFALGAILYEILTGQRAFGWARDAVELRGLMALTPAPPALLEPEIEDIDLLSRACLKALSPTPDRRPASVLDLVELMAGPTLSPEAEPQRRAS